MNKVRTKIRWTAGYFRQILLELFSDLWAYYVTTYPLLLIYGAYRRFARRFRIIWLPKPRGRPPIHENIVDLILEMKRCNAIWGSQRISHELKILGICVSKKTVLKILRENGFIPPRTRFTPPPWSTVLDSLCRHWAMDFTTVFDSSGIQIFIFAIIEVPSRKLILINSTTNPTKGWLIQQFRNCCLSGHVFPSSMVHDRDGIYGHWLPEILQEFGCKSVKTRPRSPWENPFIERFHYSLKSELLNRLFLLDNNHIRGLCISYQKFYNSKRPHQGIDGAIPDLIKKSCPIDLDIEKFTVTKTTELNGLVTRFRAAA